MSKIIRLTETVLRDGQQSQIATRRMKTHGNVYVKFAQQLKIQNCKCYYVDKTY